MGQKAKAQKQRKTDSINTSTSASANASPISNTKAKTASKPKPKLNNYNFEPEAKLDSLEFMKITRANKLRKRKNKKILKLEPSIVNAANTASQRIKSSNETSMIAET